MALNFNFVYELGKRYKFAPRVESWDKKFILVDFEYDSQEVLSGILLIFLICFIPTLISLIVFPFFGYVIGFFSIVICAGAFLWATSITYAQRLVSIREEMLQALLELSNHISLNTSFEGALVSTAVNTKGTLGKQLREIKNMIESKKVMTLGDAFEIYIPAWLEINPDFVKGINLLQTASTAPRKERDSIITEVIETVIESYYSTGKRLAEKLSNQTKTLISMGVILPMLSLILLPLITIFLPGVANVYLLLFIYVVLFPTVLLFMSMNFATNRVQVNTIDLQSSPFFKEIPKWFYIIPFFIVLIFSLAPLMHIATMNLVTSEGVAREYSLASIFVIWLGLFGVFVAIELFCYYYSKLNEKLWLEMEEIERDIPNLLQIITSYLSLNRSMESIFADIIIDYKQHGFGNHPTVRIISKLKDSLYNAKKPLSEVVEKILPRIAPSKRLVQILSRIVQFSETDSNSAAKSAKMIRAQSKAVFKLDDYIQTLLSETISIVSLSSTMLSPLLATAATVMAAAIVMALEFIKQKINDIMISVGSQEINLEFVKIDQIIPPTLLELIVGLFLIETTVILSLFLSNIKYGTDKYKIAKTIYENLLIAFILYTVLLLFGYIAFTEFLFKGVLTG